MENFLLIIICMTLGFLLKSSKRFPPLTARALNSFIICVSFPAVVLVQVPKLINGLKIDFILFTSILAFWLMLITSALIFSQLGNFFKWRPQTTGALILTAGLCNTSFVGFPLLEALRGNHVIKYAVLVDQFGTFLVFSTIGIFIASYYSKGNQENKKKIIANIFSNIVKFPPFAVLVFVIIFTLLGFNLPLPVELAAQKVGSTLVPLALFSVGFQLKINKEVLLQKWAPLTLGLIYKLALVPLVSFLFYRIYLKQDNDLTATVILETAMAPMITAATLATDFDLDAELANLMVGIGIPISILTVTLWNHFL